jgi:sugar phosphate isomerase/epimerase
MLQTTTSRRKFLSWSGAAAAALTVPAAASAASGGKGEIASEGTGNHGKTLTLGLATYTTRAFDLDKTLVMAKKAGLTWLNIKSCHLPLNSTPEQIAAALAKIKAAGMTVYAGGVISMSKEADVNQAFDYAKAVGMKIIVAMPTAGLLPLVDKKVQEYDIRFAIHNHGPGDKNFPKPGDVCEAVKSLDRRVGLCMDIGHTQRAGVSPAEAALAAGDRLFDMHFKDVNSATGKGRCVQFGAGVIDFPALFKALLKINYQGICSYEYEADEKDPLPGLCECVGYTKGVLAAI